MPSRRLLLALLSLLPACDAASANKDIRIPQLGGGKADVVDKLDVLEALAMGGEANADFGHDLELHGYTVELAAGAELDLEVTHRGSSSKLDTVLFVFGPGGDDGFGDDALEMDDDDGWGALSRIRGLTIDEEGEYLIVVGTVAGDRDRGHYRLTVECTNGQCDPEPPEPLELAPVAISEAMEEFLGEVNACDLCDVAVEAWTYAGTDPTAEEAAQAVRMLIEEGDRYAYTGDLSAGTASDRLQTFDMFVDHANELAGSTPFEMGMIEADFGTGDVTDFSAERVVLVYPEADMVVSLQELSF